MFILPYGKVLGIQSGKQGDIFWNLSGPEKKKRKSVCNLITKNWYTDSKLLDSYDGHTYGIPSAKIHRLMPSSLHNVAVPNGCPISSRSSSSSFSALHSFYKDLFTNNSLIMTHLIIWKHTCWIENLYLLNFEQYTLYITCVLVEQSNDRVNIYKIRLVKYLFQSIQ